MNLLKSKIWWEAAGTRAIKTVAQTLVSAIGVSAVAVTEINWQLALSTAIVSGILSLLTSIAGLPEVKMNKEEDVTNVNEE